MLLVHCIVGYAVEVAAHLAPAHGAHQLDLTPGLEAADTEGMQAAADDSAVQGVVGLQACMTQRGTVDTKGGQRCIM